MRNKKDIWVVSDLIKNLLTKDKKCRNDDGYLYWKVLTEIAAERGEDLMWVSLQDFLTNMHGRKYPCFETVRRSRTKIQEMNPALRSDKTVSGYRAENEVEFKHYALNYT